MQNTDQIHCPKCRSTQLTANQKGFSGGQAVIGNAVFGRIGLLAGTIGSKKIIITCLNCGEQFEPGEGNKPLTPNLIWDEELKKHVQNPVAVKEKETFRTNCIIICVIFALTALGLFAYQKPVAGIIFAILSLVYFLVAKSRQ